MPRTSSTINTRKINWAKRSFFIFKSLSALTMMVVDEIARMAPMKQPSPWYSNQTTGRSRKPIQITHDFQERRDERRGTDLEHLAQAEIPGQDRTSGKSPPKLGQGLDRVYVMDHPQRAGCAAKMKPATM